MKILPPTARLLHLPLKAAGSQGYAHPPTLEFIILKAESLSMLPQFTVFWHIRSLVKGEDNYCLQSKMDLSSRKAGLGEVLQLIKHSSFNLSFRVFGGLDGQHQSITINTLGKQLPVYRKGYSRTRF